MQNVEASVRGGFQNVSTTNRASIVADPTLYLASFSVNSADLRIVYTLTTEGSGGVLTANLLRDGAAMAPHTTSTLSGVFDIVDPGAGLYDLVNISFADSSGAVSDGPGASTLQIVGGSVIVSPPAPEPEPEPHPVPSLWTDVSDDGAIWIPVE